MILPVAEYHGISNFRNRQKYFLYQHNIYQYKKDQSEKKVIAKF